MTDANSTFTHLSANGDAIAGLCRSVTTAQARWKPSPEEWSIFEEMCHMYDEERQDFRARLDFILHGTGETWPPNDRVEAPLAFAGRDLPALVDAFLEERQKSLDWLAGSQGADWGRTFQHPEAGPFSAGEMLDSWIAHDHLHIRQLNHLHWQFHATQATPLALDYAGEW